MKRITKNNSETYTKRMYYKLIKKMIKWSYLKTIEIKSNKQNLLFIWNTY